MCQVSEGGKFGSLAIECPLKGPPPDFLIDGKKESDFGVWTRPQIGDCLVVARTLRNNK